MKKSFVITTKYDEAEDAHMILVNGNSIGVRVVCHCPDEDGDQIIEVYETLPGNYAPRPLAFIAEGEETKVFGVKHPSPEAIMREQDRADVCGEER